MKKTDLKKYCNIALEAGATHVKVIDPAGVATAPWVRLKCQFGCGGYGESYNCPPLTPTDQETRRILDAYHRALLFHLATAATPARAKILKRYRNRLIDLEGEMFKDGYYKAFVLLSGPCSGCRECGIRTGRACHDRFRLRPSLEGCGIDVFQTARNHGLPIVPLRTEAEPRNNYALLLVD